MNKKFFRLSIVAIIIVYLIVYIGIMVDGLMFGHNILFSQHIYACDITDSIDITYGTLNADESIKHNGITYARSQYSFFEYSDFSSGVLQQNYIRGCPCHVDPSACRELFCTPEIDSRPNLTEPTFHIRVEDKQWREFNVLQFVNHRCPLFYESDEKYWPHVRSGFCGIYRHYQFHHFSP